MKRDTRTAIVKLLYIRDNSTVAAHVRREHGFDCTAADVARVRANMPAKRVLYNGGRRAAKVAG